MTGIIIKVAAIALAILTGWLLLVNWEALTERARGNAAPLATLQVSYGQPVATRHVLLFPEPLGRMGGLRPHACPHEDGDPLTRQRGYTVPCVWTNPRTGLGYFIDSAEYLD